MNNTPSDDLLTTIETLEDRRYAAMTEGDVEELDALLSDRLLYSHSNGERDTKASYLKRVADGTFVYDWIKHPTESVIIEGSTAIVIGTMLAQAYWSGSVRTLRNAALAVWVLEGEAWRLVAYQPTPMPE